MHEFDVLTFDCYGTLINWEDGAKEAFIRILSKKKKSIPIDEFLYRWLEEDFRQVQGPYRPYKDILKISLRNVMNSFDINYSEDDGDEFVSSIKAWKPFPDVEPALKALKQKYKLAIISNTDNDIMAESVKLMGIGFDYIITAEDARAYKPSKKIFEYAIDKLGLERGRILHVSFSPDYDLIPAKSVGMHVAWLDRKGVGEKSTFRYDYRFKDLLRLRDTLMRWQSW